MDLPTLWFLFIAILFIGYFFLEGFDFGVGNLYRWLGRNEEERRVCLNTIGPFWDANEVWLITAGGAMFAAFPHWYATFFSGFYLPLFLVLLALIFRAVGLEFRAKGEGIRWRRAADLAIVGGSLLPSILWGVAITGLVMGMPIDADMNMAGSWSVWLHPFALLGGVVSLLVFTLHGAIFLTLRTEDPIRSRARKLAIRLWWPTLVVVLIFAWFGRDHTVLFEGMGLVPDTLPLLALLSFVASLVFLKWGRDGWAFAATGATIILATIVAFRGLFPRVMPSNLDSAWDLTIYNASSSELTLQIMTGVALVFLPLVLFYQGWSYWVFRRRVTAESLGLRPGK